MSTQTQEGKETSLLGDSRVTKCSVNKGSVATEMLIKEEGIHDITLLYLACIQVEFPFMSGVS